MVSHPSSHRYAFISSRTILSKAPVSRLTAPIILSSPEASTKYTHPSSKTGVDVVP